MKKRIAIAVSILAVAAIAAVPFVYAQPHGGMRAHGGGGGFGFFGGGRHLEHLAAELNLNDQQVEQIKGIFAELHQQNAQYREGMHDGMKAIVDTLLKNPNDTAAAQALIDQQTANERALKTNMLNATSKALNVLTAEQRTQLSQLIEERHSRVERWRK
jgi:Spy/CpxP family protein refolding chaperone